MVMIQKFMVKDKDDGYYDIYILEKPTSREDIETVIGLVKEQKEGEWTLEDIKSAIYAIFPIKEFIGFDDNNAIDIFYV